LSKKGIIFVYLLQKYDGVWQQKQQMDIYVRKYFIDIVYVVRALEVELAIEKLKSHKSPGIDQIPAELIKVGGRTIRGAIHKLIIAIWKKGGTA
jgi:hypothetical protein